MVELSIVQDDIILALIVVKHVHNCNVEAVISVIYNDCFVYFILRLEQNISVEIYSTYLLIIVLIIHGPE